MSLQKYCFFIFVLFLTGNLEAQDLSEKARTFINSLSPELQSEAIFALNDDERLNMNFVPIARKGPTFHDFDETQKKAALDLLRSSLSQEGYRKTSDIMELEKVLSVIENDKTRRDPLNYHFCIFGDPSPRGVWGWRFEGHHVSLNFMSSDGKISSSTPSFFGSNPGIVQIELQHGKEVLKQETDLGFNLVNALSEDQLNIAMFSATAPKEIFTSNKIKVESLEPNGLSFKALSEGQKVLFMDLLNVYIDNYQLGFSKTLRNKIEKAGIDNLSFSWAGSLKPGAGHYYRIQGPMLIIEYDNVQNNANHVHAVVRDLTNDFAEDILREHYEKEHK